MIARGTARWRTGMEAAGEIDWHREIFEVLRARDFSLAAHVPDAGHAPLIRMCEACPEIDAVTLTTEEEGVGVVCGAWAGGRKGVLLMQSSGVGKCINMMGIVQECRVPLLMLVTMRGQWGEFNPWQVPMGQATAPALEAAGVIVHRVDDAARVAETVRAASRLAFDSYRPVAVLIGQRMIGFKDWNK